MLIEVMISALLVGLIVVATLNGFDVTNRLTADERAHAQAAVLAQQDEDRMRSMQVSQLSSYSLTREVPYNGTKYTVTSKAEFVSDTTGSASCAVEGTSADYIKTESSVRWATLKTRPSVVQAGIVTPAPGGDLIVQVYNGTGAGVPGMTVQAVGPSPATTSLTTTTGTNGCVIFNSLQEGKYEVTTFQTGYVDKNGNATPPVAERTVEVSAKSTAKKSFQFGLAGELEVQFETPTVAPDTGDVVSVANSGMTQGLQPPEFGNLGIRLSTLNTSKTLFPFESNDVVYAGSCEQDQPSKVNAAEPDASEKVPPGGVGKVTVVLPPVNIIVMSGEASGLHGSPVNNAEVTLEDTGCAGTLRRFNTKAGALPTPGMPFGSYKLCATSLGRRYRTTFTNNTKNGPSALATMTNGGAPSGSAIIYMKSGTGTESGSTCP
jgi:Tfp pilus assembly protein PilV